MNKIYLVFYVCMLITIQNSIAQSEYTQTLRGRIIDKDSYTPLVGATIILLDSAVTRGTIADEDGYFTLNGVPVGRCGISVSFVGYKPQVINNLILKSGKELIINIELEENIEEMEEIVVRAFTGKENPLNDMAVISARSFSVEETEKYAGSWGDPSRMAANFAGVFIAGDQRNDIIIRGNSPTGLIWQLEGIPIPSPNHFDALGATGGPVSILNNNLLGRSDFLTSAFPAEYGNGISGVFDIKMRNGNNQKHEFTGQISFAGFELDAEGPISKKTKASYLISARYSMLDLISEFLWIEFVPRYKDLSFKLNFPNKKGNFSVFGFGGLSKIEMVEEDSLGTTEQIKREIQGVSGSTTVLLGAKNIYFINDNFRLINSLAISTRRPGYVADSLVNGDITQRIFKNEDTENRVLVSSKIIGKINSKNSLSAGVNIENCHIKTYIQDSEYFIEEDSMVLYDSYEEENGNLNLLQSYLQWKHKFSNSLTLNTGLHYQHFLFNNSISLEPRVGLKYRVVKNQAISIGYGLHSQLQPLFYYFIRTRIFDPNSTDYSYIETNHDLDYTKSHQVVLGYDWSVTPNFRLKVETYYQQLFNVPVEENKSHRSLINEGADFYLSRIDSLVNKGKGKNYGVEFTVEKFLSKNYYFLITTSIFDSKYEGSDNKERNTVYNGNYVINALTGYEHSINNRSSLQFNVKFVTAGGRRIIPLNVEQTLEKEENVYNYGRAYEPQIPAYFRLDGRISYLRHSKKITQEWAIDLTNITDHLNEFGRSYSTSKGKIITNYQQRFLPVGLYRINF